MCTLAPSASASARRTCLRSACYCPPYCPPNAHALRSRHVQSILKRHGGGKGKSIKGPPDWTMMYAFNSASASNTVPTSWQGASPEVLNHLKTLNGGAGWVADGMCCAICPLPCLLHLPVSVARASADSPRDGEAPRF